ncbi:hypothetical protein TB1_002595 [Malus domestica]
MMLSVSVTTSTVHRAFVDNPFRSRVTDSSSSFAKRYLSWWLWRCTALALWKKSIPIRNLLDFISPSDPRTVTRYTTVTLPLLEI